MEKWGFRTDSVGVKRIIYSTVLPILLANVNESVGRATGSVG